MVIKILNLYAGIGGNRKKWDTLGIPIEVTAIEIDPNIAKIYQDNFPNDKVIICDAHQYLLEHYKEFDFIWSSPPCPSHSRIRRFTSVERGQSQPIYPDMKLYEEIIFLQSYFDGKWVVENVISYYEPLIKPQEIQRHYFWSNFIISKNSFIKPDNISEGTISEYEKKHGFDLSDEDYEVDKRYVLRNCVDSELGLHIFKMAFKEKQITLV
jgi:DNA (cytosine-5)-methyltransferase 1